MFHNNSNNGTGYNYFWQSFTQDVGGPEWMLNLTEFAGLTLAIIGSAAITGVCCWEIFKKCYCSTKNREYNTINDDDISNEPSKCCGKS